MIVKYKVLNKYMTKFLVSKEKVTIFLVNKVKYFLIACETGGLYSSRAIENRPP